jgi:hypothetical protein
MDWKHVSNSCESLFNNRKSLLAKEFVSEEKVRHETEGIKGLALILIHNVST